MGATYRLIKPPVRQVSLSSAQELVSAHERGVLTVLGGPRSGKTTAFVRAAINSTHEGRVPQVVYLTRSRKDRLDVISRVGGVGPDAFHQISVLTFYGLAWSLVCRFSEGTPRLLTAAQQDAHVRDLLEGLGPGFWPDELADASQTSSFASELREHMATVTRSNMSVSDLSLRAADAAGRSDWMAFARFLQVYQDVLGLEGTYDYADLLASAATIVREPDALSSVRQQGSLVIVDDAEDMDDAHIRILEALVDRSTPVIVGMDPDCAVNTFRGAEPRTVSTLIQNWQGMGLPETTLCLTDGFGVAQEVEKACRMLRGSIPIPHGFGSSFAQYRNPRQGEPGHVEKMVFADQSAQARGVARLLRRAHTLEGYSWEDMAVLVRTKEQIPAMELALEQEEVPISLMGDEVQFNHEPVAMALVDVLRRVTAEDGLDEDILDPWGRSAPDVLRRMIDAGRKATGGTLVEVLWTIWEASRWQIALSDQALSRGPSSWRANRDLDAVIALFALATKYSVGTSKESLESLVRAVDSQEIPDDLPRSSSWSPSGVQVMTAHRAKSLSWPIVAVIGLQEGVWPARQGKHSMITLEGLSSQAEALSSLQLRASERRLAWIAFSAAKSRLYVTAVSSDESTPSALFDCVDVPPKSGEGVVPRSVSLTAMVAEMRQALRDEQADPALRQAAAERIAGLTSQEFRGSVDELPASGLTSIHASPRAWWPIGGLDGAVPQSSTIPVGDSKTILSASSVESLLTCPRQWFLSRQARDGVSVGPAQSVGLLVHDVVQDVTASVDDMMSAVETRWDHESFEAQWVSTEQLLQAQDMITRFEAWRVARGREVLGCEVDLACSVDLSPSSMPVKGRIDRIERDSSGGVWVIDFKTGSRAPTKREAAENLQLGVYQVALAQGALDDLIGEGTHVAGGELVYLRVASRKGASIPKTLIQESVTAHPYLDHDTSLPALSDDDANRVGGQRDHPSWVHHRLAGAKSILESGRYPAVATSACRYCDVASTCPIKGFPRSSV